MAEKKRDEDLTAVRDAIPRLCLSCNGTGRFTTGRCGACNGTGQRKR